jgi:stage II sporulation protein AB (anti-sigma F factor)
MYQNKMRLEIQSRSQNEAFARVVVAAFAAQLDPTIEEISDIKTAVSEAVTNAIIHGYEGGGNNKVIEIIGIIEGNRIIIEVNDKGVGIADIELARQPLYTSKPELERSGMGFTVMETFMDSLSIESNPEIGTKIIMSKTFKQN